MADLPPDAEEFRLNLLLALQAKWQSYMDSWDRLARENPDATGTERMRLLERASEVDDILKTHLQAGRKPDLET